MTTTDVIAGSHSFWRQGLSCCRSSEQDGEEDTTLCQITLNLNCCASHNTIRTVATDGSPIEEDDKENRSELEDDKENRSELEETLYNYHRQRSVSRTSD